jgi:glycosyltransferase involved in cell wall biosynthesis
MGMDHEPKAINELSVLKARLYEKERIEEYLRAEVKELWTAINSTNASFLYKFFLFSIRISRRLGRIFKNNLSSENNSITLTNSISDAKTSYEVVFVIPSNKVELGGIKSSFELAKFFSQNSLNLKIVYLDHDPTGISSETIIHKSKAKNLVSNIVVACGSEATSYLSSSESFVFDKKVTFFQGSDQYFDSSWNRAAKFIDFISESDLVLAISPYMAKVAKFYGARNIVTIPLGLDLNAFYYQETLREKIIVVPCRSNIEKGTRLIIPLISKLRELGWTVIGFGDLPDINMANQFDDFLGRINSFELGEIFRKSQILLDPSFMEGLGLTPLEAAACGCIPIIGARGSYKELFEKGKEPFLEISNFLDPYEVIKAIKNVDSLKQSKDFSEFVLSVDWSFGYKSSLHEIRKIINKKF